MTCKSIEKKDREENIDWEAIMNTIKEKDLI